MENSNSIKRYKEFGYLVGFGFPLIIGYLIPYFSGHAFRTWTLFIGIPILIIGIIKPYFLKYPFKLWMKIGHLLGWINSKLILGIVYIVVLQPISLVMKLLGHDPLKKINKQDKTYRQITNSQEIKFNKIF